MEFVSTVVIKVRYEDMMRRFNARIVDEEFDLNMDGLKEKILSLFWLTPGTEIMLTYIDEDGDAVALADDDDLRDVMKQGLDPVRITAKVISTSLPPILADFLELGFRYLLELYSDVLESGAAQTKIAASDMSEATANPRTEEKFESCMEKEVNEPNDGPKTGNTNSDDRAVKVPCKHKPRTTEGYWDSYCDFISRSREFKLDARLIKDMTNAGGTILAPQTQFTRIWRMRNSGSLSWPRGTRLVTVGSESDIIDSRYSVELEIPAAGLPVGQDLDIALDVVAPDIPGPHLSYWRLVSPYGEMFGPRVGLLIEVYASVEEEPPKIVERWDLNLPFVNSPLTHPPHLRSRP